MQLITPWRMTGVGSRELSRKDGLKLVEAMASIKYDGAIKDSRDSSKNIIYNYVKGKRPLTKRILITDGATLYVIPGDSKERDVSGDLMVLNTPDVVGSLLYCAKKGLDFVAYKADIKKLRPNVQFMLMKTKQEVYAFISDNAPDNSAKDETACPIGEIIDAKSNTTKDAPAECEKSVATDRKRKAKAPKTKESVQLKANEDAAEKAPEGSEAPAVATPEKAD